MHSLFCVIGSIALCRPSGQSFPSLFSCPESGSPLSCDYDFRSSHPDLGVYCWNVNINVPDPYLHSKLFSFIFPYHELAKGVRGTRVWSACKNRSCISQIERAAAASRRLYEYTVE